MSQRTKIAIVGVGRWGKSLLAEFSAQADIGAALHGGNEETASFLRNSYPGIKNVSSFDEIASDSTISAVAIATPPATHFDIASAALRAGKHVFLEKPGGSNEDELASLAAIARENSLVLAIGYEYAHHAALAKAKELLAGKKIVSVHFDWRKWGTFANHPLTNLFCHDASVLAALGIVPDKAESYSEFGAVTEADILLIRLSAGGIQITSSIDRTSPEKRKSVTIIADGTCLSWIGDSLYAADSPERQPVRVETDGPSPVAAEISDFLSCVSEGRSPVASAELGLRVWRTLRLLKR